jgi:SagB-type dehydrogenase family enzyme
MRCVRIAAALGLSLSVIFVGCSLSPHPQAVERVRELNEIPIAQLRVMLKGFAGDWRAAGASSSAAEEPPAQKPVPSGSLLISLPTPTQPNLGALSVRDAIAARRSTRHFSDAPLSLEELAFLLWATQGITGSEHDPTSQTTRHYRAAPSAGARYPLETYLAVSRVEGVACGIYQYLPEKHQIALLREDPEIAHKIKTACYEATASGEAAVTFIWSATPRRTEWKYAYLAHRMIAMEAGHVCENLYLAAVSCHIGACALLSYHQPRLDELLELDGLEEFSIYLACVGKAADAE